MSLTVGKPIWEAVWRGNNLCHPSFIPPHTWRPT